MHTPPHPRSTASCCTRSMIKLPGPPWPIAGYGLSSNGVDETPHHTQNCLEEWQTWHSWVKPTFAQALSPPFFFVKLSQTATNQCALRTGPSHGSVAVPVCGILSVVGTVSLVGHCSEPKWSMLGIIMVLLTEARRDLQRVCLLPIACWSGGKGVYSVHK